jgi:hypothetical protein
VISLIVSAMVLTPAVLGGIAGASHPETRGALVVIFFLPAFFLSVVCLFMCWGRRWARVLLLFFSGMMLAAAVCAPFAQLAPNRSTYIGMGLNVLFSGAIAATLAFARPLIEHTREA